MKNYRFSKQSNYSTKEKTPLSIGVNCLDIDDTGQVLLGGGDDGSLSIWGLDESLHRNDEGEQELINKRLNYIKRQPHQSDDEPTQIMGYKNKRTRIDDNNTMRLVHSFQTQRNKYRMYRQSSAQFQFKDHTYQIKRILLSGLVRHYLKQIQKLPYLTINMV